MSHPYIPLPNTVKIEILQTYGGESNVNVHYAKKIGSWGTSEMDTLAADIISWMESTMAPLHDEGWTFDGLRLTDVRTETGPVTSYTPEASITGTHAAAGGMAGNAALVVTFKTAKRGRSYRGRAYIGGLPNVYDPDNNHVGATYADSLKSAYEGFAAVCVGDGWAHVIASQYQGGAWLTTGIVTEVTSYSVDRQIDSQRRRLSGRGV